MPKRLRTQADEGGGQRAAGGEAALALQQRAEEAGAERCGFVAFGAFIAIALTACACWVTSVIQMLQPNLVWPGGTGHAQWRVRASGARSR